MNRRRLTALLPLCVGTLMVAACTGPTGLTGATGAQGPMGVAGPQGTAGVPGPQGPAGPPGAQGTAGLPGGPGSTGMAGAQGPTGMTGAQGGAAPSMPATRWTSLTDFLFDYDKADIRFSESRKPSEVAAFARQNPSMRVGIDGSTDSRGSNRFDVPLTERRIITVRDALIQAGVPADRIEMGGFGSDRAACNPAVEMCARRDGRVEVLVRAN